MKVDEYKVKKKNRKELINISYSLRNIDFNIEYVYMHRKIRNQTKKIVIYVLVDVINTVNEQ